MRRPLGSGVRFLESLFFSVLLGSTNSPRGAGSRWTPQVAGGRLVFAAMYYTLALVGGWSASAAPWWVPVRSWRVPGVVLEVSGSVLEGSGALSGTIFDASGHVRGVLASTSF